MLIAVIGCGSIGCRHLRNLMMMGQENLIAVDTSAARLTDARAQVENLRTYSSVERALEDKPQAAIVATPPATHSEIAFNLLSAKVPVLIEKPLSHTVFDSLAIQAAADTFETMACVGYSMRFHPAIQLIRDELLQEIGKPLYARAEVGQYLPDWHPNEDYTQWYMAHADQGGGALLDLSHEIDYLQHLLGGHMRDVKGFVGKVSDLDIDSDDLADFTARVTPNPWVNGVQVSVHMDLLDRSYNRRLCIVGTEGTIDWDWDNASVSLHNDNFYTQHGVRWYDYSKDRNVQFEEEMKAFIESVQTKTLHPNLATIEDGIEVLKVVEELKSKNGLLHQQPIQPRNERFDGV